MRVSVHSRLATCDGRIHILPAGALLIKPGKRSPLISRMRTGLKPQLQCLFRTAKVLMVLLNARPNLCCSPWIDAIQLLGHALGFVQPAADNRRLPALRIVGPAITI